MASKRANKKLIPKDFVTLFKVCRSSPSELKVSKNQDRKPAFSTQSLPMIPKPSSELQHILFDYSLLNAFQLSSKSRPDKVKKSKLKPINSFIAFRSFYSRAISHPEYQRELSCKLAMLWKEESHRDIWEQYTLFYNNYLLDRRNKLTFVDWLLQALNLKADNSMQFDKPYSEEKKLTSGTVQDLYLVK
ncbi:MTLALPHA1 [Candida margitis]|uniref:MTLALPHA1 n=1 Tax=Candida margitis TaxID=1775924 RepID=UPI0022277152|nr:MTLALPHA1 [Candida margitis]KAI5967961.1 MTLALPHA1 [Candida margitis]